uniref:Uncharacterized protein n=1 Tax=Callorhinchus milii TaxID=7868 RepID=A0A4W3H0X1_CALMI
MEKKRRARINECLLQLKSLLEIQYSNSIRKRKLEKADILELTVKHLRSLQSSGQGETALGVAEFQSGFRSCLNGVSQYLLRSDNTDQHVRLGMLNHLVNSFPVFSGSSGFSTAESVCLPEATSVPGPHYVRIRPAVAGESPNQGSALTATPGAPATDQRKHATLCSDSRSVWRPW